jgi:HEAT repeat protein
MRTSKHDVDELLELTHSTDGADRCAALRELCPCHVRYNDPRIWDRALELASDSDVRVRATALHVLCDGSPRERHDEVVAAVSKIQQDPDEKLRRQARKVMAIYRRTGKINVL